MWHRRKKRSPLALGGMSMVLFTFIIALLDLTTITSATGIITAAISIPHVNPPPKDVADKSTSVEPVALFVQNSWGNGEPHDIDTHMQCFSMVNGREEKKFTVNYMQRSSGWIDLQRDDLGKPSYVNVELIQSNSEVGTVPPNTVCQVNAHLYHSHGGKLPVVGKLIMIANKDGKNEVVIADIKFTLKIPGEEITLVTVVWDENGNIISDAITTYPRITTVKIATAKR